jgi:LuxR family transcriptional regulator, maltose regulon positive regulatory protein
MDRAKSACVDVEGYSPICSWLTMSPKTRPPAPLAKLAPPRLGRVFERERVFAVLDSLVLSPGLWIAAAPGAGKSTAIATWLQARARRTLWLQVDAGDADPATLAQSLDALICAAVGRAEVWPPFGPDDAADIPSWFRRRVRAYLHTLPPPWTLVFDNAQELPADSGLQGALARALAELPEGVQWVFVSRESPPAAFAAAIARQQLALADPALLPLDVAETLALTRLHGRPDAMAQALAAAKGWAGGMTLMLVGSPAGATAPGPAARERLFDYFAGEVLAGLEIDLQRALGAVALLPAADRALTMALTGRDDVFALLERLAAQSLFTDRREAEGATVYVFHALFADFLRKRLEHLVPPAERQALGVRAGRLLLSQGQPDAGLRALVDAGAWDEVVAELARVAPAYAAAGRLAALRAHLASLPEPHRRTLAYWCALCALDAEPAAALVDLDLALGDAAGDADAVLAAVAARAAALLALGRPGALDGCLQALDAQALRAAEIVAADASDTDDDRALRIVPGLLAAVVYRAPWHHLADALAARVERLLHRASAPGQRLLLGTLAFHLLWRGHIDRLERIVDHVDTLSSSTAVAPRALLRWWGVGVLVKTLLGRSAEARADARRALDLIESEPALAHQRVGFELQAMLVALAERDRDASRRHLDAAARALLPEQAVERSTLELQRGILALLEQDAPTALRLMRASAASARGSGFAMREHIALIAHALAAAFGGAHDEAAQALDEVFAHPFHAPCRWHHWVAGSVAAYAALQRGDEAEVLVHLRAALGAAAAHGFRHGPMLFACGDMMARLMALALTHGIEPEVARDVVRRNALAAPAGADERWPWPLRVHALGGWRVELDGAPLPSGRKESRRLLELLRLLASAGEAPLPQSAAVDALWPDADGDAARNALDNALHRLRRLLGGDDRVLLRHGALALNPQRCWTDVGALERRLAAVEAASPTALPRAVLELRAAYPGVLLPADETPGIPARRAALHRRMVRTLHDAARRAGAAGDAAAAEVAAAAADALGDGESLSHR